VKTSRAWLTALLLNAAAVSACAQPQAILRVDPSHGANGAPNSPDHLRVLEGVWEYEEGGVAVNLKLDEQGNGTYPWKNGEFLTRALSDRIWTGTWRQPGNDREGGFEVKLSDDYSEGEGRWWYTRIADDTAPDQPGGTFHLTKVTETASGAGDAESRLLAPRTVVVPSTLR
jgi:hypothetical protein